MTAAIIFASVAMVSYTVLGYTARFQQMVVSEGFATAFARTGETDLRGYAIRQLFESVIAHLVLVPVVFTVVGGIGGLLAVGARRLYTFRTGQSS